MHEVTITFHVDGTEKHAEKLAAKAEAALAGSKRIVEQDDGAILSTTITDAGR